MVALTQIRRHRHRHRDAVTHGSFEQDDYQALPEASMTGSGHPSIDPSILFGWSTAFAD